MEYCCKLAKKEQMQAIFSLYPARMRWMDEQGICQWNRTNYLGRYPLEYYEAHRQAGRLYVLQTVESGQVVGAMVLLETDARWPQDEYSAYYVHNLVTKLGEPGAGRALLREAERLAARDGKQRVRLDCAVDNVRLNRYYAEQNYRPAGRCVDGPYAGILREKDVSDNG